MPAYCTHYIFAKEMMPILESIADFPLNRDAVLIGTQGPDIFFFHRILPWMSGQSLRRAGSLLHRAKPGDLFDAMADYLKQSQAPVIAKSYIYGFLLHYALDRRCHPFVYSQQETLRQSGSRLHPSAIHNTIEMAMDSVMLHQKLHIEQPHCFRSADTVPQTPQVLSEIGLLLADAVPRVTGVTMTQAQGVQAVQDTQYAQRLLHDEHGIKTKITQVLETIAAPLTGNFKITSMLRPKDLEKAKKYGNIANGVWRSPYENSLHTESFFDLYALAQQDAKDLVCGFASVLQGEISGKDLTKNLSFLTGVEVK